MPTSNEICHYLEPSYTANSTDKPSWRISAFRSLALVPYAHPRSLCITPSIRMVYYLMVWDRVILHDPEAE